MSNLNIDAKTANTYDVIVIGSGISGGWAAKEFTEKGLRTLVLERGRDVQHIRDYPTTNKYPYEFEHRGDLTLAIQKENPIASRCYVFREDAMQFVVKDHDSWVPGWW
jgi:choline dehydrogenase-like flavoprotein